jgi:hypothetical protein
MKREDGLCYNCARFHPKAKGNCVLARSWMGLERKHKFKLMVYECEWHIPPKEVFPVEEKTGNKKIDEDEGLVE